jgi:hypothetical protein
MRLPPRRCPLPEGLLWLLLTGELPTAEQTKWVTEDLRRRSHLPKYVCTLLDHLPHGTHPMTQLAQAVLALQVGNLFLGGGPMIVSQLLFRCLAVTTCPTAPTP